MAKNLLLICNGLSGSGKTTFIQTWLGDAVYNLKSMTTRGIRNGETWGEKYYYVTEADFAQEPLATRLFVNEAFWQPGDKKWLYGVPEFEIYNNLGQNLVYDVIQPRYTRQLTDWFDARGLDKYYEYKILWFLPPTNSAQIVQNRANMPRDMDVRRTNTCDAIDFLRAGLQPDCILKSSAQETITLLPVRQLVARVQDTPPTQIPDSRACDNVFTRAAELARAGVEIGDDFRAAVRRHVAAKTK